MNIGEGFRQFRKSLNLTQKEFAEKANISRSYLGNLEKNRGDPSMATIKKIIEPFDIQLVKFLVDYCGVKRVENDEEAMERALYNSKNENDPTQQFFSSFVDIADIKGFEFDGEPLSDKEQTALLSIIELIKSNKE